MRLSRWSDAPACQSGIASNSWPLARRRLAVSLAVILAGLGVAWIAIEVLHQVQVTVFQPFRMATLARGIALILIAGRVVALWRSGDDWGRVRAIVLATGFLGDWLLVVATLAELSVSVVEVFSSHHGSRPLEAAAFVGAIAWGLNFLGHHDTESGHIPLLAALSVGLAVTLGGRWKSRREPRRPLAARIIRPAWCLVTALIAAWIIPVAALMAGVFVMNHPEQRHPLLMRLIDRCRFVPVPQDDIERLALWCREHTPPTARFIGPPGPKTFRLWSRRSLAFNRAASPYHAAGLADWFARFAEHVDFHGTPAEFVHAYLADRHRFEARYQALSDVQRAALAVQQGASYVIAAAPRVDAPDCGSTRCTSSLELLHVEGRFAVYQVRSVDGTQRHR